MEKLAGQKVLEALETRFQAFEASLNGHAKTEAHAIRKSAFDQLMKSGLPHAKNEEYKFTNLTKVLEKKVPFGSSSPASVKVDADQFAIAGLEAYQLVFVNGILDESLSDMIAFEGVSIKPLSEAIYEDDSLFNSTVDDSDDSFVIMNTAFANNGIVIEVKDKVVLDKPIMLQYVGNQEDYAVRNLFSFGKFAEATIIEKFDSIDTAKFSNIVNEISIDEQANIKYFKIENDRADSLHINNTFVTQQKDSTFTANTIALNGEMVRNNLNIKLEAEGCEAYMNGLYLLSGKTHVDNHTVVDHTKPNAYSNELYKGIMDDKSTGVFNGKIFVRQDAQKTNAFQSNKNILLTNDATVNTKPQLEIWADDVKCSHGCTTGQIDKDALFYLQARGIKKDKALAILLHAFASDVLENLENNAIQDYVEAIITERLEK
jgi:Fe-S cluster assembly protein SufD